MRIVSTRPLMLAAALVLAAGAASTQAQAGNVNVMNGQPVWTSSCSEPMAPASVKSASSSAPADDVNTRMTAYNTYASQMQDYMNCVSQESENDSTATSRAIANNAQQIINDAQMKVKSAGVYAKSQQD